LLNDRPIGRTYLWSNERAMLVAPAAGGKFERQLQLIMPMPLE
jgi:hypothetical protein